MALHAQRQGFQTLQNQEGVHRADGRTHIAQWHHARAGNKRRRTKMLGIIHAMVRRIRRGELWETFGMRRPIEFAPINDGAADAVAMTTNVFGQRFHHNVCTQFQCWAQQRRGHGVVHHQRQALCMCRVGKSRNVDHIDGRIAYAFAIHQFGFGIDQACNVFRPIRVDKAHFHALVWQSVGKQIVSAAVQGFGGDDVVTRADQGLHRIGNRCHA